MGRPNDWRCVSCTSHDLTYVVTVPNHDVFAWAAAKRVRGPARVPVCRTYTQRNQVPENPSLMSSWSVCRSGSRSSALPSQLAPSSSRTLLGSASHLPVTNALCIDHDVLPLIGAAGATRRGQPISAGRAHCRRHGARWGGRSPGEYIVRMSYVDDLFRSDGVPM